MIVGRGMLARSFDAYAADPDILFFASGVSNSQETRAEEFRRERELLLSTMENFHGSRCVYFGSCGVTGETATLSPYLLHKLHMERIVISRPGGIVFRLPQIVSKTPNPHTLANYLRDRILGRESFQVWSEAERNIIDIDDAFSIVQRLLETEGDRGGGGYSIASEKSLPMIEIVRIFEQILGVRAKFELVSKGDALHIHAPEALQAARELNIDLGGNYVERVLRKYYGE